MLGNKLTRRELLRTAMIAVAGSVVAACAPPVAKDTVVPKETVAPEATVAEAKEPTTAPQEYPLTDARLKWVLPKPIYPRKRYPDMELTQTLEMDVGYKFKGDENPDDNIKVRTIEEATGVHIKSTMVAPAGDPFQQAYAVAMASGELPEFLTWLSGERLEQFLEADMLEDITEIYESMASDLVKERCGYPDNIRWKAAIRDGRVYGFAFSKGDTEADQLLWVRKDLLDAAGLGVPDTVEQIGEAGRAFIKDGRMPLGVYMTPSIRDWLGGIDPIFGAYGIIPKRWALVDGKLVYNSVRQEMKPVLELLAQWYKDGILSPEWPTANSRDVRQGVTAGQIPAFFGRNYMAKQCHDNEIGEPGAEWAFCDTPAGPDGTRMREGTPFLCINAFKKGTDPEKIEAFMDHLNWVVEIVETSSTASSGWYEGYTHEVVDGEVQRLEWSSGWEYGAEGRAINSARNVKGAKKRDILRGKDPSALNPWELYTIKDPVGAMSDAAALNLWDSREYTWQSPGWGPPGEKEMEIWADLDKPESEVYVAIINGKEPLSYFDEFVDEWLRLGGEAVTKERNDWLASVS